MTVLADDADPWCKSRDLRKYVEAARAKAIAMNERVVPGSDTDRWLNWAIWPHGSSLYRRARWIWPDDAKVSPYGWYRNGYKRTPALEVEITYVRSSFHHLFPHGIRYMNLH